MISFHKKINIIGEMGGILCIIMSIQKATPYPFKIITKGFNTFLVEHEPNNISKDYQWSAKDNGLPMTLENVAFWLGV